MIKLIGIAVVAAGFALRINPLLVVLLAGIATGLVSGLTLNEVMAAFGSYFVENRFMTMPIVLMLPLIGLLERYGLQQRAEALIRRSRAATAGRVILLYTMLRQAMIAVGVKIGGHAEAVRPLVAPMAEAAARQQGRAAADTTSGNVLSEATVESIRAHAAAGENIGNFFGEDIFISVGAILLMAGFFEAQHLVVSTWAMALWGIPTAVTATAVMAWRLRRLDRRIDREAAAGTAEEKRT